MVNIISLTDRPIGFNPAPVDRAHQDEKFYNKNIIVVRIVIEIESDIPTSMNLNLFSNTW